MSERAGEVALPFFTLGYPRPWHVVPEWATNAKWAPDDGYTNNVEGGCEHT